MPAPAALDEFVCFAMYTASHATTQAYREVLKPWKLTYPQYLAMVVLATGERTVSGLGVELGLDSGTLSPLLRRLEERGLVSRRRDADDERVVRVELTAAGRDTHAEVVAAAGCLVPAFVDSGRGLGELLEQLAAITANMRAVASDLRTAA
ncbi:MarR family winged helix-turn-helix transcriptional regulator [Microbacterium laevaniformans]|uniref:MarR family winged helix-turn-helix transcriptional regulator n=1 Tax=Microbacterium laevaniformans TaxID=36807 RepID=UPI0025D4C668|nr:MarR family transcriptional regulator [uncultured Microbacterium sp.]